MRTQLVRPVAGAIIGGLLLTGCGSRPVSEGVALMAASADSMAFKSESASADHTARNAIRGLSDVGSVPSHINADRKIIYTANIELAVEDFSGVPERVTALARDFGGYLAGSNQNGSTGESRRGTWTIRIPVERYDEFLKSAKSLGELIRMVTDARDVSEEYVDVDARIRNKTKEEERLLQLLEERPGKLEDVVAIERELSRVREELERMQGRMRVLSDLTSLTTVELTVVEIRGYQPPQAPTLATQIRRTWTGSLAALESAGKACLLGTVAIAPWLPLAAIVVTPAVLVIRRISRRVARSRMVATKNDCR